MTNKTNSIGMIRVNVFHQLRGWPHKCYIYRSETPSFHYITIVGDLLKINTNVNIGTNSKLIGRTYQTYRAEINQIHDSEIVSAYHIYMGEPNARGTHSYLSYLSNKTGYKLLEGIIHARAYTR